MVNGWYRSNSKVEQEFQLLKMCELRGWKEPPVHNLVIQKSSLKTLETLKKAVYTFVTN